MTTCQSASLAVHGEVKRGEINVAPQAPLHCGGEAPADRSEFFTSAAVLALPRQAAVRVPPPTSAPVIAIDNLAFTVKSRGRAEAVTPILADLSLTVREREFVSIVGPSGCGKSTLLNFIAGLLPVQSGRLSVAPMDGRDRVLGYMFQQHGLLPWRNVQRNVELGLEVAGVPAPQRASQTRRMLEKMGLAGFERHFPREISGGMRQRVALARTLVTRPEVMLMDEPFGALDAQTRVCIQELFGQFWEEHRVTVLFVTHDIDEALFLSDRVLVMGARPGRVVAQYDVDIDRPRTYEQLRHSPRFRELYDSIWHDIRQQSRLSMRGAAHE